MFYRRWSTRIAAVALAGTSVMASVSCGASGTVRTDAAEAQARAIPAKAVAQDNSNKPRALFIRGAIGSAPAGEKNPDDASAANAVSDITNLGDEPNNSGFGQIAQRLADAGYDVSQLNETGPRGNRTKVNLAGADLSNYKVVIFGSNNATYDSTDAKTVENYVNGGGGVLFMSDTNWGPDNGAAPTSDSALMKPFGMEMNQDNGQPEKYTNGPDYKSASHPMLKDMESFGSLGVSACTKVGGGSNVTVVVKKKSVTENPDDKTAVVTRNDNPNGGTRRAPTDNDGAIMAYDAGEGRVVCLFDRDQFFNPHLAENSHGVLAQNVIDWLTKNS